MHISVPFDQSVEFINATEVSPLISKVQVKVLYVGEQPNRNGSVITKEVATEMGRLLPGSPIVGYYNAEKKDFEQHNRQLEITKNGEFNIIDTTKPYGFVSTDAKVWFQKFLDDDNVVREYLVTEAYIWTEAYPESKRIITNGNNQSMELFPDSVEGNWTEGTNSSERFFIINEAIIEKLCVLGENVEPCFEGAQVKTSFSLKEEFEELKNTMYAMINELKTSMDKGGATVENEVLNAEAVEEVKPVEEFAEAPAAVEEVSEPAVVEEFKAEEKKEENSSDSSDNSDEKASSENQDKTEDKENSDSASSEKKKEEDYQCASDEKDKKYNLDTEEKMQYNLNEIAEYVELKNNFDALNTNFAALTQERDNLLAEIAPLRQFKLEQERKDKQSMIDSFYMLSDEDKADVRKNIDTYSLDDIEAKLAVICVRNKVSFNLDEEKEDKQLSFSLSAASESNSDIPDWVKAVKATASNM